MPQSAPISVVHHLNLSHGHADPLASNQQLELVLRGIRRRTPITSESRLPITPLILREILRVLQRDLQSPLNITMWAACALGYFAFLRSGEFTIPSASAFNPTSHLTPEDITVDNLSNPTLLRVTIKQSKMDQFHEGATIFLGRTDSALCPVARVLA